MKWLFDWLTKNLSNEQLRKLRTHVHDRWAWDTGCKQDRMLFDALEEEMQFRELTVPVSSQLNFSTLQAGNGIVMTEGDGTITINIDDDYVKNNAVCSYITMEHPDGSGGYIDISEGACEVTIVSADEEL